MAIFPNHCNMQFCCCLSEENTTLQYRIPLKSVAGRAIVVIATSRSQRSGNIGPASPWRKIINSTPNLYCCSPASGYTIGFYRTASAVSEPRVYWARPDKTHPATGELIMKTDGTNRGEDQSVGMPTGKIRLYRKEHMEDQAV